MPQERFKTYCKLMGLFAGAVAAGPLGAAVGSIAGQAFGQWLGSFTPPIFEAAGGVFAGLTASKIEKEVLSPKDSSSAENFRKALAQALQKSLSLVCARLDSHYRHETVSRIFEAWDSQLAGAIKTARSGSLAPLDVFFPAAPDAMLADMTDPEQAAQRAHRLAWELLYDTALCPIAKKTVGLAYPSEERRGLRDRTVELLSQVFPGQFAEVVKEPEFEQSWKTYQELRLTEILRKVRGLPEDTRRQLNVLEKKLDALVATPLEREPINDLLLRVLSGCRVALDGIVQNIETLQFTADRISTTADRIELKQGKHHTEIKQDLDHIKKELRERSVSAQTESSTFTRFVEAVRESYESWDDTRWCPLRCVRQGQSPRREDRRPKEIYTVESAIAEFPAVLLLGEPGSGKTTQLQHLAWKYAAEWIRATKEEQALLPIPIYVWLPNLKKTDRQRAVQVFEEFIVGEWEGKTTTSLDNVDALLHHHPVLLLVDGLDVVDSDVLDVVSSALAKLKIGKDFQVVMASRAHKLMDYKPKGFAFETCDLIDLKYPQDVLQYGARYLLRNVPGPNASIGSLLERISNLGVEPYISEIIRDPSIIPGCLRASKTRDLSRQDRAMLESTLRKLVYLLRYLDVPGHEQLRQMAGNPLLLDMLLVLLNRSSTELPSSRAQVLESFARLSLQLDSEIAGTALDRAKDKQLLLEHLGAAMNDVGLVFARPQVEALFSKRAQSDERLETVHVNTNWNILIRDLIDTDRLLVESHDGSNLMFWHQSLQEYFAAAHIKRSVTDLMERQRRTARSRLKGLLKPYISKPRWHDSIAIAAGLIEQKDDQALQLFMEIVWRKNRLLGATCLRNLHSATSVQRVNTYVDELKRRIVLVGRILPPALPVVIILLIGILLTAGARVLGVGTSSFGKSTGLPRILLPFAISGMTFLGVLSSLSFFRTYVQLRSLWEARVSTSIRHWIKAAGYIQVPEAETFLAGMSTRPESGFVIGDTLGRVLRPTGIQQQWRTDEELIVCLRDAAQRAAAAEALLTRPFSQQAVDAILEILLDAEIDNDSHEVLVDVLVEMVKTHNQFDEARRQVVKGLIAIEENVDRSYRKRMQASQGLLRLGEVRKPLQSHWSVIRWICVFLGAALLLVLSLLLYLWR